jgi:hypothetical protein
MSPPAPSAQQHAAEVPPYAAPRSLEAGALLLGGALAFAASFLPLGQAVYPADFHQTPIVTIPARELATVIGNNLHDPASASFVGTGFWTFALWGAPLGLAVLGLLALLRRQAPASGRSASQIVSMLLVVVGAGFTLVSCWGYLTPIFGSGGATRSLVYGPAVALLGYLSAVWGLRRRPGPAGQRPAHR